MHKHMAYSEIVKDPMLTLQCMSNKHEYEKDYEVYFSRSELILMGDGGGWIKGKVSNQLLH